MICIDIGSGYNPKEGYLTCDINAYCDYYDINEINDNSVDKFHSRNVLHHINDLNKFINIVKEKLKNGGEITIIDCNEENYKTNLFLDRLWYRYIFHRPDIYIHENYRDLKSYFKKNGFTLIKNHNENEKIILNFKLNKL